LAILSSSLISVLVPSIEIELRVNQEPVISLSSSLGLEEVGNIQILNLGESSRCLDMSKLREVFLINFFVKSKISL